MRSRVKCKFLQDVLDVAPDQGRKFSFSELNHVEGSLRFVWVHILEKLSGKKFMILRLVLLGVVESDCAFKDLSDFDLVV